MLGALRHSARPLVHFNTPRIHSAFVPLTQRIAKMSTIPTHMKAIQISKQGGVEVLEETRVEVPKPKEDEVLIKVQWAGVNFIDNYMRSGLYPMASFPATLGVEAAGIVADLGSGAASDSSLAKGDAVAAYAQGAFAEYVSVKRAKVVKLPSGVSTRDGATALIQGLTAWTLLREAHPVKHGDAILVHAAAGGTGLLLCQMGRHLGATVIGTVSTDEKAQLAKANGATHAVKYADTAKEVERITHGAGAVAIFDGVGKDTFEGDFDLIARKGTLVTFGNASGPVPPVPPFKLSAKNVKLVRPRLDNYVYTREEMELRAGELFDLFKNGTVQLKVHKEYDFSKEGVAQSQTDIASRTSTGKLLIRVE